MKHLKKFNENTENEFELIDLVDYLQDLMDHYDIYLHGDGDEITMQDIIDNNEIDDFDKNDFQNSILNFRFFLLIKPFCT